MTVQANSVTIRTATREDMPAIANMAAEFRVFLASMDNSDPAFDIADATARLERFGFDPRPKFSSLIAETGDAPKGYAIYSIGFWADSFEGMILMSDLFVRQAWRGQGVGRQLMCRLAEIGRDEGCGLVMWTVWKRNHGAMRFYENLGAVAVADERLMQWSI